MEAAVHDAATLLGCRRADRGVEGELVCELLLDAVRGRGVGPGAAGIGRSPVNWRQAKGEVSHAWLTGLAVVPVMTLSATWATLLRVIEVTPFAVVPAPTSTSHWAKPAPLVKAGIHLGVDGQVGGWAVVLPAPL